MVLHAIALLAGLAVLALSADKFIDQASALAKTYNISPLIVGLVLVSIGTSAPEIFVSAIAAFQGAGELSIGNALGSNIANIGLVLGLTVLITPVVCHPRLLAHEIPLLLIVTLISSALLLDGSLSLLDAIILISLLGCVLWLFARWAKQDKELEKQLIEEADTELPSESAQKIWLYFFLSLAAIIACAQTIVWGATNIALTLGIPEIVIGVTIVALGTSLPELAATLGGALKGNHDLAIGTVIGSNLFNLLTVLPMPGFAGGLIISDEIFYRDMMFVLGLTILLAGSIYLKKSQSNRISRGMGTLMVLSFIGYYLLIYFNLDSI